MGGNGGRIVPVVAVAALFAGLSPGVAQTASRRGGWMGTLLERTILRLDVLTADLCVDDATAARLERLSAGGRVSGAVADSVTRAVLDADHATARVEFRRDLRLDRFLDAILEDQGRAVAAGLLPDTTHAAIRAALPEWFAPLQERGLLRGDRLFYEIGPDSVRSTYVARDGTVLIERTDAGRQRRNSVLATWLAPGASLRNGLLRSLERGGPDDGGVRRGCADVRAAPAR